MELQLKNRTPKYLNEMVNNFRASMNGALPNFVTQSDLKIIRDTIKKQDDHIAQLTQLLGWIGIGIVGVIILLVILAVKL